MRGKVIAKYVIEDGKKTVTDKSAWFNTHDLAECVDGRYRILGRADDLIVAPNGENLNPNLTEPQLRVAGTNGVCLIRDGKTPVLLVSVNRYTAPEQLQRLDGAFKERIAALHLTGQIGRIVYTSAPLMADDEFKLNRRRLSDDCRAGRLPLLDPYAQTQPDTQDELMLHLRLPLLDPYAQTQPDTQDELMRHLRQVFAVTLGLDLSAVAPQSDFFADLGGASLDYFAAVAKLQEDFSMPFPQDEGKTLSTAQDFYHYIKKVQSDESV